MKDSPGEGAGAIPLLWEAPRDLRKRQCDARKIAALLYPRSVTTYVLLCAWTYPNDHAAAHDLMDHAVQNAFEYLGRHIGCSDQKLLSRIKSAIKRRARQQSAKKNREIPFGSLLDLERMCVDPADAEQRIYASELLAPPLAICAVYSGMAVVGILLERESLNMLVWTTLP